MLDLLGDDYVIERLKTAVYEHDYRKHYEFYVTNALKAITQNTSSKEKVTMLHAYSELFEEAEPEAPKQSAKEVKEKVLKRIRKLGGGKKK